MSISMPILTMPSEILSPLWALAGKLQKASAAAQASAASAGRAGAARGVGWVVCKRNLRQWFWTSAALGWAGCGAV